MPARLYVATASGTSPLTASCILGSCLVTAGAMDGDVVNGPHWQIGLVDMQSCQRRVWPFTPKHVGGLGVMGCGQGVIFERSLQTHGQQLGLAMHLTSQY